jgi:dienelactone hydrolase
MGPLAEDNPAAITVVYERFLRQLSGCLSMCQKKLLALLLVIGTIGCDLADDGPVSNEPYLARRAALQTKLVKTGPAPQDYERESPPANIQEVTYPSGSLQLNAWVFMPPDQPDTPKPALVFFHGGFAFGAGDMQELQPFMDAGYVVMCPMLRGENGNPGNFELFWGEVDDAKSAVKWLAEQPYVDRNRIYTFGHSVGGGISALVCLHDDVPIQHGGSSGGLYGTAVFRDWSDIVPFDRSNKEEARLRVLVGNVKHLQKRHIAYLGQDDQFASEIAKAKKEMADGQSRLEINMMPGDHFTSFQPALQDYLKKTQSTAW